MKNYLIFVMVATAAALTFSCNDMLELEYDGRISLDDVVKTRHGVTGYLNTCYENRIMPSLTSAALADESQSSDYIYGSSLVSRWYADGFSASTYYNSDGQPWTSIYQSIRKCNIFLGWITEIKSIDISSLDEEIASWKAQAHTLRALHYLQLIKRYGAIPLVTEPFEIGQDFSVTVREPVSVIVKQILDDCDAAMSAPEGEQSFSWTVRANENWIMTRAVVQAIRSQAVLYAASPLYTDGTYTWAQAAEITGNALSNLLANDYKLWDEVPDATIGQNAYDLYFITQHDEQRGRDKETIYGGSRVNIWRDNGMPSTLGQASAGACPTQELVDCYEMQATGLPPIAGYSDVQHLHPIINAASGYDPQDPYTGRDPRFYATIWFNGAKRSLAAGSGDIVQTYAGGSDAITTTSAMATHTGYYLRKCNNWQSGRDNDADGEIRMFRMAEMYLNFAEAAYQSAGPDAAVNIGNGMTMSAREAVNVVRRRVGMPDLPANLSKDEFEKRYRNERRVELAYEGHRYFDVRRWKIMESCERYVTGMKITLNNDASFTYERIGFERQSYGEKLYFYPIPQAEVNKMQDLTGSEWQNPGWN